MWFMLLYLQISAIQGLNVALRGSTSPCKGRLEVRAGDGRWGLACHHGWKEENGQVVCKSLKCGHVKDSGYQITMYKDPPPPKLFLMDQVTCISNETSLWECPFYGGDNLQCKNDVPSFVAVECTGNVKLSLNGQRDKCAGTVEYTTQNGNFGVCKDSAWGKTQADKICQELKCGDCYRGCDEKDGLFKGQTSEESVSLKCDGKEQFSWQCMYELSNCMEQVGVICKKHKRFRLRDGDDLCSGLVEERYVSDQSWVPAKDKDVNPEDICTQLNCGTSVNFTNDNGNNGLRLTCSGKVNLRNFTSKCFGDVMVSVNGSDYGVCYSKSNKRLGEQVCKELGCGELLDEKEGRGISNGLLSNVECLGDEASLWHCLAKHEIKQCKSTTVICEDSLDMRLSDGLGRCSGRVELQWEGKWKSINSYGWTNEESNIVCEHLKCGQSTSINKLLIEEKQNQLESWHFKCVNSKAKIYECLKEARTSKSQRALNVKVICQKEELMFFEGDSPCRGRVLVKSFGETEARPLPANSVADKTKANDTCRAMQCGDVVPFIEQNGTYGTYDNITCSGSVNVTLRNKLEKDERCWGTVEVCTNDGCGGVCMDTWTNEESTKICDGLGCGKPIQITIPTQYSGSGNYYSVYCLNEGKNLSMCRFIPISNSICSNPAQVICTDSVKAKLEDPRDKCAGTVSLYYNGKWTPVCQDSLDADLGNTICRELNCGQYNPTTLTFKDKFQNELPSIECKSDASSVSKCKFRDISGKTCSVGYLQCTEKKRLLLYEKRRACSGPVYAHSGEKTLLVSGQGWGKEEGQKMCQYLQCGDYISHSTTTKDTQEWWSRSYNCSGKTDIWECERHVQAPQLHEQLNITCHKGNHSAIVLSKNCTGEVRIKNESVRASLNNQMYSELCSDLGCGTAFHHWSTDLMESKCWDFSCTGKETVLWQCGYKMVRCDKVLSLACQKGIEFGSTEKCGGKLVVNYGDQWEYVCKDKFAANTTEVCKVLDCMNGQPVDERDIAKEIKVTIKCPENYQYIHQCVQRFNDKCKQGPVEIKCEGYGEKVISTGNSGLIVGLALTMLGLLMMLFMWMNRKRLLLVLRNCRNKNEKDINIDRNEMNNMEKENRDLPQGKSSSLEYDEYEDADPVSKTGEEDADDKSEGSSGTEYDDIEGQNRDISPHQSHADDDLPLLPKRSENILADQDTYEVETEKQEDYDDVMAFENAGMADALAQVDVAVDAGTDSEAGADALVVTTEVEVHAEQE
ncbi:scavenger receptor cysteine-rich type 1 protein M130 isoform X3 [Pimephales promelas]|uniref:scavenger receptor cysteine-rich type 1 protein M130 isoform X3 n=1 Tax=Pimephales promelas TaxID=90988 RepID=UPI001955B043|nr:scavenger receptor cysteine-rich type 1 protein M130 isoform X3 [Pimephales promelas]